MNLYERAGTQQTVDNETLRSEASRTLLARMDTAMLQTAQPLESGRLVVTAGQDEHGEPELLKLLMVLAESRLLMIDCTPALNSLPKSTAQCGSLQTRSPEPGPPKETQTRYQRQRTKEEAICLLQVLRTMAGAVTLRAQGQTKEFTKCCVRVITSACHMGLPFVLESAVGGSSASRIAAIETLSHLACSSQIAKMMLGTTDDTSATADIFSVLWSGLTSTDMRLGAIKTVAHLAASCRNEPGCISRLALTRQLYAKLLQLAKRTDDKNELLHCLKAVDLMMCDKSVAIAISANRSAMELAVALLNSARGDWHESHRLHIQTAAVSIIARVAARVTPRERAQIATLALGQLLHLIVASPAAVQSVADIAVGNLAKGTPAVLAQFGEMTGKTDKRRFKQIWDYLATNQPQISYLALVCLKDTLRSDTVHSAS